MIGALFQLLVALIGAILISVAVQGFRAEWLALFKRPFGSRAARILVYVVCFAFQIYNGIIHGISAWEIIVLALLTAWSAIGIYYFMKKKLPA